jgi:Concanavalin A-like lectin/glucanases superfamily
MYIDDQQIGIIQVNKQSDATREQKLRIGANSLELDKFFKGEIDEVRIWNRGLTVNEIHEIYDNKDTKFIGQVEYLNFGKNTIMNFSKEITKNNTTNNTDDVQATTKPFVEILSYNQGKAPLPLSNKSSFIDNAIHWIDNAKASFVIKTNN